MVALLLALFVAAQSAGQAPARRNDTRTWYQAYADGKRAFDQKNWQAAIDSLEAAKRARAPKPGRKIPFYGDVYDDYLPDYYLGIAYLNLRQFTQADQAFAAVRASGLIGPKDREYAEFQRQTTAVTAGLRETATVAQNNQAAARRQRAASGEQPASREQPVSHGAQPRARRDQHAAGKPADPTVARIDAAERADWQRRRHVAGTAADIGRSDKSRAAADETPPTTRPSRRQSRDPSRREPKKTRFARIYQGSTDQAAALLNSSVQGPGATPRAFFYLACSRTALAILGQGSSADVDGAKQLLARAGNPAQFAEDRRYVSPRVLRMLGLNP